MFRRQASSFSEISQNIEKGISDYTYKRYNKK